MSDKASLRAALAKAAEDGDEDAKRALAAFDAKAGDSEDDDKKDAKAVKAESDDEKKDDKKEDAKAVKAAAAASDAGLASTVASLAATVNALQAEKAATERKAFFAANPHISAEVQASLAHLSLEQVKGIVAALPKPAPNFAEAAGATATGTAGAAEGASGEITYLSPQARDLDIRMGLARLEHSVEHGASTLTLGVRKVVTGKGVSK